MYIRNIFEYLEAVYEIKKEYPPQNGRNNAVLTGILYRGQSNDQYSLLPGILRKIPQELSDRIYLGDAYTSLISEYKILQRFIREASIYVPAGSIADKDYIKWLALAQHYGVPTRFLDWTANPLVALYFACEKDRYNDAIIWFCHMNNYGRYIRETDKVSPENNAKLERLLKLPIYSEKNRQEYERKSEGLPRFPFFILPKYFDERMSVQASYFLTWGTDNRPFEKMFSEDNYMEKGLIEKDKEKRFLYSIRIRGYDKQHIMRQLNDVGINAKSLFPGLDGLGKYIERFYRFDYDEMLDNI